MPPPPAPSWFDATLRQPRPRRLVPTWRLWTVHGLLAAIVTFFVLEGTVFASRSTYPDLWKGVVVGAAVFAAGLRLLTSKPRALLRDGVAALARVVPSQMGMFDTIKAVVRVVAADVNDPDSRRIVYEYPTGPNSIERGSVRVRTSSDGDLLKDARFPNGVGAGARFVVLFDPRKPERHVLYNAAGLYRIVPADGSPAPRASE